MKSAFAPRVAPRAALWASPWAAAALLALPAAIAAPASAQGYGQSYGQGYSQSYGSNYGSGYSSYQPCQTGCGYNAPRRRYNSYNGQADVPGDYRCDAYWDASRTDCSAAWRDQRSGSRRYSSSYGRGNGYGQYGYGGGQGYGGGYSGGAVYQGQYGQPDVVYSGGGYPDRYGHDHSAYGQGGRDPQRINWCCAEYRTYDPASGYYTAYSGQRVFCG